MTSRSHEGSGSRPRAGRGVRTLVTLAAVAPLLIGTRIAWGAAADAVVTQGRMQVLLPSRPAAGYFILENHGDTALVLSGASAPDCTSLMLHQSTNEGGTARMAMLDSVPVPPHGTVRFAPGGYHLMCMDPSGTLLRQAGTEPVTLHFSDGGSVSAGFAIHGVRARLGAGK